MIGPVALERTRFWAYLIKNPGELSKKDIAEEVNFGAKNSDDVQANAARSTVIRSYMQIPQRGVMQETKKDVALELKKGINFVNYMILKEREELILRAYNFYNNAGSQNFLFGKNLVEEFSQTDVDDILVNELQFPYQMAYYKFENTDFVTLDGQKADGIFIGEDKDEIIFLLVSSEIGEPWFDVSQKSCCLAPIIVVNKNTHGNVNLAEAMAEAYQNVAERSVNAIEDSKLYVTEISEIDHPESYDAFLENAKNLIHESVKQAALQINDLSQVIINALMVIDGGGITSKTTYEEGTPADLAAKATSSLPGAGKAQKKLKAQGFVMLRHYEVTSQYESLSTSDDYRQVRPHFRRGHWRKQRYGTGLSQIKRIRIAPVIVKGKDGEPEARKGYKIN